MRACLQELQSHMCIGNLVFVHAGVDPEVGVSQSLKPDRMTFNDRHWAWIKEPFLQHKDGFDGRIIVHGHTPSLVSPRIEWISRPSHHATRPALS